MLILFFRRPLFCPALVDTPQISGWQCFLKFFVRLFLGDGGGHGQHDQDQGQQQRDQFFAHRGFLLLFTFGLLDFHKVQLAQEVHAHLDLRIGQRLDGGLGVGVMTNSME